MANGTILKQGNQYNNKMPDGDKIPPLPKGYEAITNTPPLPKGYVDLKKKVGSSDNGTNGIGGFSTQQNDIQKPVGQISNEQVNAANQQLQSAKNNSTEQNISTDIGQKQSQATQEKKRSDVRSAAVNTANLYFKNNPALFENVKKNDISLKNIPTEEKDQYSLKDLKNTSAFDRKVGELMNAYDSGELTTYKTSTGEDRLGRTMGNWDNFTSGLKEAWNAKEEANKILSMSKDDFIKHANEKLKEDENYLPVKPNQSSVSYNLGSAVPMTAKGVVGAGVGSAMAMAAPETMGLSTTALPALTAWLATVPDMANQAKANSLVDYYHRYKQENPNATDDEAYQQAQHASDLAGSESLLTGTALNFIGESGLPANTGQGLWKATGQWLKNQPQSVLAAAGIASGSSALKDAAIQKEDFKITPQEILDNANKEGGSMATMQLAFNLGFGALGAPKYLKAQGLEVLSKANPETVQKLSEQAVQNGWISQEQIDKGLSDLSQYQTIRKTLPENLDEDKAAAITGLIQKNENLEAEKKTQNKVFHDDIDAEIDANENKAKQILSSSQPLKHETDQLTGERGQNIGGRPTIEETEAKAETLPASENNENGNSENGYKPTDETGETEKGVGEVVQPQQENKVNLNDEKVTGNNQANETPQQNLESTRVQGGNLPITEKPIQPNSVVEDEVGNEFDYKGKTFVVKNIESNGVHAKEKGKDNSPLKLILPIEKYNEITGKNVEAPKPIVLTPQDYTEQQIVKKAEGVRFTGGENGRQYIDRMVADGYDKIISIKRGAVNKFYLDNEKSNAQLPISGDLRKYAELAIKNKTENPKTNSVVEDKQTNENISQPLNTEQESKVAASNDEGDVSGVKKAITQPLRSGLNLPKVELPKMGGDVGNLEKAKVRVDKGESNPLDLVDRILKDKNGFRNEDEVFDMQYYGHQLKQQEGNLKAKYAEAETETEKASVSGQIQQLSDEVDRFTEANQTALNKWGKIGNAAQVVVDEGFNPSREKLFIKDAYGGEIPKDVQLKIDAVTKERDVALTALKEVEEKLKKAQAEKALGKFKKAVGKNKEDIAKLKDEAEQLKQQLRQAFKKDLGNINAGIPIPKETLEVLGKLAINYLKQGALTVDAIASKIYDDLKDEIKEPFTKKDVRDWLTNAANITEDVETAKLNRKAQNIEDKVTPTILDKEGKPREQKPIIPPKSQIKAFQNSSEWVKANQRVINAEYKMKVLKRQAFESQKNWYQKGLMWFGRLTRLSVLSGYNVLYKLAAASTIGGALKRIPEQAFGGIYSQVFKGISEKAPIEGSLNALSEAKFYKEFFNPKKFVHNTWEILKTGESDLSKKFSTGKYEHVKGLYLPTDLHQIIKDPLKRGTFESSFRNALIHAEKNGLDINDPLIINSIESAAFKRANYEIFQEQNALTKKFTAWKNQMEKSGNIGATGKFLADFLVPVSTVPTNIVRRLVTTSPIGLIRGGIKVVEAYRKGVESLSNEQADAVMRQLKQGSFGTALWLVGWFGYSHFGGLYSKYDPDKKRREGELASDEMEVDGNMIPAPVQHALPFEIIQWAATARRIHENYTDKKDANEFTSIYNAGLGSIGALIEQIPIIEETGHLIGAASEPYEANKLKDDVERRFEPQILRETGVIPKETKPVKSTGTSKTQVRQTPKRQVIQHR